MKVKDESRVRTETRSDEAARMLALLRERVAEANDAGHSVLRLDPQDLRNLGSEAGAEGDAAGAFRALVLANRVRLRGRWREGISGVNAPVYVVRLIGPSA